MNSAISRCLARQHRLGVRRSAMFPFVMAVFASFLPSDEASAWDYFPMPARPGTIGVVVGDFDGDGRDEALIGGNLPELGTTRGRAVLAVLGGEGSQARVRALSIPSNEPNLAGFYLEENGLVLAPAIDGHDHVIAHARSASGTDSRIAIMGGVPMQVERLLVAPPNQRIPKLHAVADVDGDGQPEIVASLRGPGVQSLPAILDWSTGAAQWIGTIGAESIAVAQLDADPALELVLSGTPGLVIDGMTHTVEWSWAGGFDNFLLAGHFQDPSHTAFATLGLGNPLQIFSGSPYTPVTEFPTGLNVKSMLTYTSKTGSLDQIVAQGFETTRFFDPLSGAVIREMAGGEGMFAIGDLNAQARPQLMNLAYVNADLSTCPFGDGTLFQADSFDTGRFFRSTHLDDGSCQKWLGNRGSYAALARANLAGAGSDLVASYSEGDVLTLFDADTGAPQRVLNNVLGIGDTGTDAQPHLAVVTHLGTTPTLVLAAGDSVTRALDPLSLEVRWNNSVLGRYVSAVAAIDTDGDGNDEVILATSNAEVAVLDGTTGVTLRQSAAGEAWSSPDMVTFRNGQGQAYALITAGNRFRLDLVDLTTATLVAQTNVGSARIKALWQWGEGPNCRLAILDEQSAISVRECASLAEINHRQAPPGTVFVRQGDAAGTSLIVAAGQLLYELDAVGNAIPISNPLGNALAKGNAGDVRILPDGQGWQITVGSDTQISMLEAAPDLLFDDGFD